MKRPEGIPTYSIAGVKKSETEKDFEFHQFDNFAENVDHLKEAHKHDHYSLFFITHGSGEHLIDFESFELIPKRFFLLTPGQVHAWGELKEVKGFVLLFTQDFFSYALQYQELRDYLFYNTQQHRSFLDLDDETFMSFKDLFVKMEKEYKGHQSYSMNIIRSYMNILLFQLTRIYQQTISIERVKEGVDQRVIDFEKLLDKNHKSLKTVADYAALLFISPNYLNAICQKEKGRSAGELIRERVMLEAKRLLAHSDKTIAEIAYELNFEDNSYFGRFFKKYSNQTPSEFREQVKNFTLLHPLNKLPENIG